MGRLDLQRPHKDEQSSSLDCPGRDAQPNTAGKGSSGPAFDPTIYQIHNVPEDVMVISNDKAVDVNQSEAPPTSEQTPPINQTPLRPTVYETFTTQAQSSQQAPQYRNVQTQVPSSTQISNVESLRSIRDTPLAHPNLLPPPPQVRRHRYAETVGPDGRPLGPDGRPLGPDGRPLGPDGRPLGPDGRPLGPDGRPLGPDGRPLSMGPEGRPVGPEGRPVGPDGRPVGPDGRPIAMGPESRAIIMGPEATAMGPEAIPIALSPDDQLSSEEDDDESTLPSAESWLQTVANTST
jgi:hypothetical protein